MSEMSVDRRGFLKGALAAGALAAGGAMAAGCAAPAASGDAKGDDLSGTGPSSGNPEGYVGDGFDWLGAKPEIVDDEIVSTIDADVVICGSGHAGMGCAVMATEGGKKVVVIDKAPSMENHHFAGGEFGNFNSEFLKSRGFGDYDLGEIVSEFCIRGGNRVNANLIRAYVENSGPALDKILEKIPAEDEILSEEQLTVHVAYGHPTGADYPIVSGGYKTWAGDTQFWGPYNDQPVDGVASFSTITKAWNYSIQAMEELGAQWFWNHEALVCEQDESGKVTGVIAEGPDGYVRFNAADAVVLATGGFEANPEMCWSLITEIPEWNERNGLTRDAFIENAMSMTTNDGAGHKMGCWAGGFIEAHPRSTMDMGGGGGGPWGHSPFLVLNAEGNRFMNEASAVAYSPLSRRQPIGVMACVTDSKWLQTVQHASVDHGCPNYTRPQYYDDLVTDMEAVVPAGAEGAGVRSACITERNLSTVYGAETLEDALRYAGYAEEAIPQCVESVKRYNELCYAGRDADFGKDADCMIPVDEPPYYVAPSRNDGTQTMVMVTLCGLTTDDNMNVIGKNYERIENLYAIGNCLGGRWGNNYSTPTGGASIGMAGTHGYVLGKYLAEKE